MIVRLCARLAAVMALRHQTWAGERVYDSDNTPLQEAVKATPAPFIVVYTDDVDDTIEGRDTLCPDKRQLKLVLEFGLAGRVEATDAGPPVAIPATDEAIERAVDLLEYQIATQLFHQPDNEWGEILRLLVPVIYTSASNRAGEAERGVRWAARQRVFIVDTIGDPTPGQVLPQDHAISKFMAMATADEGMSLASIPDLIQSLLSSENAPAWRQAQAELGLTEDEVRGIGVAPPYLTPDGEVITDKIRLDKDDLDHATADNIDERVNRIELDTGDGQIVVPAESENQL